jgi:hypothetical protein
MMANSPSDAAEAAQRLERVLDSVRDACRSTGRSPDEVALLAVSKKHGPEKVRALAEAGQADFGESYVQEALGKQEELADLAGRIRWHFVGGLQSNKARQAAGRFALIHSVDSAKLARKLSARAEELGQRQAVLMQVNVAGEAQKSGTGPDAALRLAEDMAGLKGLDVQGLMTMPPHLEDPEAVRPYFAALRRLRDTLRDGLGLGLPQLSMGMSHDFVQAIEEGATIVRVGTALFGPRPY